MDSAYQKGIITAIEPRYDAAYINLQCGGCNASFTTMQTIVAGMAVGEYNCPSCQAVLRIYPEDFLEAATRLYRECDLAAYEQIMMEASRVSHQWAASEKVRDVLSYEGINLGELTSFTSYKFIAKGLVALRAKSQAEQV